MNQTIKRSLFSSVALGVVAVAACVKPPAPMQPRPQVNSDSIARARADSIARADSLRLAAERQAREADSLRLIREAEQRKAVEEANALKVLWSPVYFDYDQAQLTDAAQALLDAKVPALRARPELKILVTGHTDDRGSSEYNLALGLRRAGEVKRYLVASGIEGSRIEATSMGAERPAVEGSGEDVWSQNRRAEFAPLGGGVE